MLFKATAFEAALYSSKERASTGAQKYDTSEYRLNSRHFTTYFVPQSNTLLTLRTSKNKLNKLKEHHPQNVH